MEEEEGDWYKHTGGTGTVDGTDDTVGSSAFAGSILRNTWNGGWKRRDERTGQQNKYKAQKYNKFQR